MATMLRNSRIGIILPAFLIDKNFKQVKLIL